MIEIWAKLRGLWARQKGTWRHHVHLHAFLTTALDVSDQPEAPESSTQEKGHRFPLRGQTGHKAGLGVFGEQEISWEFGSFKKKNNERSTNLQSRSTMFFLPLGVVALSWRPEN